MSYIISLISHDWSRHKSIDQKCQKPHHTVLQIERKYKYLLKATNIR